MHFLSPFPFYNTHVNKQMFVFLFTKLKTARERIGLKSKRILKFYFCAQRLNDALDNLIVHAACSSGREDFWKCADKVISLISAKQQLASLWGYLDGVMQGFDEGDRTILRGYAFSRVGYSGLPRGKANRVRRVVVRFMRRARSLRLYGAGVELVGRYYALLGR